MVVRCFTVEPATVVKVEAPLNGRVLWKGLPRVLRPRACSGSPYRINKKDSTNLNTHFEIDCPRLHFPPLCLPSHHIPLGCSPAR